MPRLLAAVTAQGWIVRGYAIIGNNRPGSRSRLQGVPNAWNGAGDTNAAADAVGKAFARTEAIFAKYVFG
jgi:hypothetical protein